MLNSTYRSNPLRGDSSSKFYKLTISPAVEARAVQSLLLPAEVLCAGLAMVAHEFQPVDIVGGDFGDYFLMDNGKVGFYVGDVSGKYCPPRCTPPWQWELCVACTKPISGPATSCQRSTDV